MRDYFFSLFHLQPKLCKPAKRIAGLGAIIAA